LISAELLEDREALTELIKVTARELPLPVKKKRKNKRTN